MADILVQSEPGCVGNWPQVAHPKQNWGFWLNLLKLKLWGKPQESAFWLLLSWSKPKKMWEIEQKKRIQVSVAPHSPTFLIRVWVIWKPHRKCLVQLVLFLLTVNLTSRFLSLVTSATPYPNTVETKVPTDNPYPIPTRSCVQLHQPTTKTLALLPLLRDLSWLLVPFRELVQIGECLVPCRSCTQTPINTLLLLPLSPDLLNLSSCSFPRSCS